MKDGLQVDLVVTDPIRYNAEPISGKIRISGDAFERFLKAMRTGEAMEFGPAELLVASDLLSEVLPGVDLKRTMISTSPSVTRRQYRWKLTFSDSTGVIEFPLMDFVIERAGTEEIRFKSKGYPDRMPLQLAFTVKPTTQSVEDLVLEYSYIGHEIRSIYKTHQCARMLNRGCKLLIHDLDTDQDVLGMKLTAGESPTREGDLLTSFIAAVYACATALGKNVRWNRAPTEDDILNGVVLGSIISTGYAQIPVSSITLNATPEQISQARESIERGEGLTFLRENFTVASNVFDTELDPGAHKVYVVAESIRETRLSGSEAALEIKPSGPITFEFDQFKSAGRAGTTDAIQADE
jgi:hypothetical protein